MKIETAKLKDIPQIAEMELITFTTPWVEKTLREAVEGDWSDIIVAKDGGKVLGYIIYYFSQYDANIMRVDVDVHYRNKGIATKMHQELLRRIPSEESDGVFLEVRESNERAKHVYGKWGYKEVGRRKGFYQKPEEDALTMHLKF